MSADRPLGGAPQLLVDVAVNDPDRLELQIGKFGDAGGQHRRIDGGLVERVRDPTARKVPAAAWSSGCGWRIPAC
ncbi:hypothetical protein [Streptomyces sp. NPDC046805]|uniref:hypothetical protein n=1 Tax=Streptomyces sp. NPDC046805 TaxID=3155134 RepID=UPI0033CD40C6